MQKIAAIIFLLLFSFHSHSAGYAYGGLNYSFNGVISKNDAYNGATTLSPGLVAGVRFNKIGLEVFGRKFTMVNDDYVVNNILYEVEVDTLLYGLGMRLSLTQGVDFILGANFQNVQASSTPSVSGLLNKDYMSYYIGGGFNRLLYPKVRGQLDMAYYRGDVSFGILGVILSVVYEFTTF